MVLFIYFQHSEKGLHQPVIQSKEDDNSCSEIHVASLLVVHSICGFNSKCARIIHTDICIGHFFFLFD